MPDKGKQSMDASDVRTVVHEVLAEQGEAHADALDKAMVKTVAAILLSFGIEEDDRKEIQADFQHLRRWRKSVEQAQTYTFKAIVTVIAGGIMGALWLGFKAMLGRS